VFAAAQRSLVFTPTAWRWALGFGSSNKFDFWVLKTSVHHAFGAILKTLKKVSLKHHSSQYPKIPLAERPNT